MRLPNIPQVRLNAYITGNDICISRINLDRISPRNMHAHWYSSVGVDLKCPEEDIRRAASGARDAGSVQTLSEARDLLRGRSRVISTYRSMRSPVGHIQF